MSLKCDCLDTCLFEFISGIHIFFFHVFLSTAHHNIILHAYRTQTESCEDHTILCKHSLHRDPPTVTILLSLKISNVTNVPTHLLVCVKICDGSSYLVYSTPYCGKTSHEFMICVHQPHTHTDYLQHVYFFVRQNKYHISLDICFWYTVSQQWYPHGCQVQTIGQNFPTFSKIFQIQIFIAIFGFSVSNALQWAQTSLVLVQWFLR